MRTAVTVLGRRYVGESNKSRMVWAREEMVLLDGPSTPHRQNPNHLLVEQNRFYEGEHLFSRK